MTLRRRTERRQRRRRSSRRLRAEPRRAAAARGTRAAPMRLPAHRATTANLQAVYPFIVETGSGPTGCTSDARPDRARRSSTTPGTSTSSRSSPTRTSCWPASSGVASRALAKTLAYRLAAFGVRVVRPCDPKGEWGVVARALGAEPFALGRGMPTRINPLDPGRGRPVSTTPRGCAEVRARRIALLQALAETGLDRQLRRWSATPSTSRWTGSARPTPASTDRRARAARVVEALMRPTERHGARPSAYPPPASWPRSRATPPSSCAVSWSATSPASSTDPRRTRSTSTPPCRSSTPPASPGTTPPSPC